VDLEAHKEVHHEPSTITHTDMMGFNIDYRDPADEEFDPEGLSPAPGEVNPLDAIEQAALNSAYDHFFDVASEVSPEAAFRAGWVARASYPPA
jgi:hypothetical protein